MENPNANSPVAEDPTGEIGNTIWRMLEEHFQGALVFDPIVVEIKTDHEGDDYVHTYIVFDGDFDKLDHDWTMKLSGKLWRRAEELGYPGIPVQSFVHKSEWKNLLRMLRRKIGTPRDAQNR